MAAVSHEPVEAQSPAPVGHVHRLILDTDLGTDVDDAYALAVLADAADVELRGVTTVYGDPRLRARLASRLLRLLGTSTRVIPGSSDTLSGAEPWMTGEEGAGYDDLDDEQYEQEGDALSFLIEETRRFPGEIEIVAIGPLTNLARAIAADPEIVSRVRRVWIMGGRFDQATEVEHNFRSDAVAAHEVFASGIPITVAGVEMTRSVHLVSSHLSAIGASGPFGAALERDTRRWMVRWGEDFEVPHDAVVALAMLQPGLFTVDAVHIAVEPRGPHAGRCVSSREELPNARVVRRLESAAVAREIVGRVCEASENGRLRS